MVNEMTNPFYSTDRRTVFLSLLGTIALAVLVITLIIIFPVLLLLFAFGGIGLLVWALAGEISGQNRWNVEREERYKNI